MVTEGNTDCTLDRVTATAAFRAARSPGPENAALHISITTKTTISNQQPARYKSLSEIETSQTYCRHGSSESRRSVHRANST